MKERTILVDGKEMKMRASALVPRLYRAQFGRDMIADLRKLAKAYRETMNKTEEEKEEAQLSVLDLEIFENTAWIMLKHSGEEVGETPEEWLDSIEMFSIYENLPVILELWAFNQKTTSVPKKK